MIRWPIELARKNYLLEEYKKYLGKRNNLMSSALDTWIVRKVFYVTFICGLYIGCTAFKS
jgi:hypothetical protein